MDSTINVSISALGMNSSCSDSGVKTFTLLKQTNDNIENAIPIVEGNNGPFNNFCATIQNGEPVPPDISCTGQKSWCDEYGNGQNLVEHSVWFTYKAQENADISLFANGFDCEMAIYDAASYLDLINGNYTMIAANDDSSIDVSNPALFNVPVVAGKTYWIQVDGSGGGLEGTFSINISRLNTSNIPETGNIIIDNLIVYPQPASSQVNLENENLIGKNLDISVYSAMGKLVYNEQVDKNLNKILTLNTSNWMNGLYILKILADKKAYVAKIIKQ